MRMSYEELLNKGLIKRFKESPSQVKNRIELAKRDIKSARAMMANDRDWAFAMAYNAILQATRALMKRDALKFLKNYTSGIES